VSPADGRKPAHDAVSALLDAYRSGLFPMAHPVSGAIMWCSPEMRGILPMTKQDGLHVSRSLERRIRSGWFELRADTDFENVLHECAAARDDGSWIDGRIVGWYCALFERGHAHCIEAWRTDPETGTREMVGGVYGVSIGAAFFGESMFSRPRARLQNGDRHPLDGADASKVCLIELVRHLGACGYELFDTQFQNEHIAQFGVHEIPHEAYLEKLAAAADRPDAWRAFDGT